MAFEKGNQDWKKRKSPKLFDAAIKRALMADDGKALRKIADQLVAMAEEGDMAAIREVIDRTDGKPHQTSTVESFVTSVRNVTDDELADIATSGSAGTTGAQEIEGQSPSVH